MKTGLANIVSKSNLSQELKEITDYEIGKLSKCESNSIFDSSEISNCPRKLLYKSVLESKDDLTIDKFNNKFAIKKWAELLRYYVVGTNIPLSDCNYNIVGNADIVLKINYSKIILKIQSVNDEDFNHILIKGAFKRHVLELMVNEWLAEIKDGLIIYENRNDFRFEVFQVYMFAEALESIKNKCRGLVDCKIKGVFPSRPYKENNAKECDICNYKTDCWSE